MSRGTRYALAAVALMVAVAAAVGLNSFFTEQAISQNDHRWCDTLNLLTSQPVSPPANPAADPSRESEWKLYSNFVTLRGEFGCR